MYFRILVFNMIKYLSLKEREMFFELEDVFNVIQFEKKCITYYLILTVSNMQFSTSKTIYFSRF